jgi:hypothetical protein
MNWTVIWMPPAEEQLAAAWLAAADRNAVTRAADDIDLVLETFPTTAGEPLFDTVYEYEQPPLTVEYETDDANHTVYVLRVWNTAEGPPDLTGG